MGVMKVKKDAVAFLMPCGGPVDPVAVQYCINMAIYSTMNGYPCTFTGISNRTLIHTARNMLAKEFLDGTDCEWAFWCDSDMILEARTIPTMVNWAKKLNTKFLTGVYYQRGGKHGPVIWKKKVTNQSGKIVKEAQDDYTHYPIFPASRDVNGVNTISVGGPPFKVDVAGFGCILVHREVIASMHYPYFKFNSWIDPVDGRERESSEDFHFCIEAAKIGYDLWAVPELECGHMANSPIITFRDCKIDMNTSVEINNREIKVKETV